MKFHIETERLLLRELRISDLDGMFELDSNPEVHRYLGNKPIKTMAEADMVVQRILREYKTHGIGRWAAIEKISGHFIGWSGIRLNTEYNMNGHALFYDIGYRLLPKYWGKGYATESGKAALNYAFTVMKLPELYGITEMGNTASHKALLKIGLCYLEDFYSEDEQMMLRWYSAKNPNNPL